MNSNIFCPSCGTQVMNGQQSCPNCGYQLMMNQMNNQQQMNVQQPMNMNMNMQQPMQNVAEWKNTKAVVGLILGIISFFVFGFLAFIGLSLGITGLNESKQHGGKGKGVAIAAIVVGGIFSAFVILGYILRLTAGV